MCIYELLKPQVIYRIHTLYGIRRFPLMNGIFESRDLLKLTELTPIRIMRVNALIEAYPSVLLII